ncbi:PREDICTED: protein CLEC16A-like [Nanorana parkeri]|uniref:protein CLEC16A-like n=1 Tax=Nanorana parkeri TaxID=125878 RepID=UPI000854D8B5|nr:PREDICTED: protein CLEC16A-like [Nanorana parkeri]
MEDTGFRHSSSSCLNDSSILDQPPVTVYSEMETTEETLSSSTRIRKSSLRKQDSEITNLAPSLTPAPQPTISLISDNTDALSAESLTLVPPVDPESIHTFSCILESDSDLRKGENAKHSVTVEEDYKQ